MYYGMNGTAKAIFGLSGLFIPTSSAVMILNTTDISPQTNKYLDLVSNSGEKVWKAENLLKLASEKKKAFMEAPNTKFDNAYKDLVDLHLDERRCYVKVSLMKNGVAQKWYRNLEDFSDVKEKERIAMAAHTLGKKTLEDACYSVGIGGVLWIKENTVSEYIKKISWALHTSKRDSRWDNYWTLKHQ